MRQVLAVPASFAFAVSTIALASPAHANSEVVVAGDGSDQDPYTVTVDGGTPINVNGGPNPPRVQIVGPQISFTNNSDVPVEPRPGNGGVISLSDQDCSPAAYEECRVDAGSGPVQFSVTPGVVNYSLPFLNPPSGVDLYFDVTLSYQAGGGGSASSESAGSAPASVIQQFGLPASGNCEDGATEAMNWSGIGMDGWGISWAQWANDGAGGAVCTRTVMYDTSTAKWVVN